MRFLLAFVLGGSLVAQVGKLAPDLDLTAAPEETRLAGARGKRFSVIVQRTGETSGLETAKEERNLPGRLARKFEHLPAEVREVTAAELAELAKDPTVEYISPADREVTGELDRAMASVNFWPANDYINNTGLLKGGGIGIAVLDSGIDTKHPNLAEWDSTKSRVVYSQSFNGPSTADQNGHGTHVAGLIASVDNVSIDNNVKTYFWAPAMDAKLINLKVLDAQGKSTDAIVIQAIDRAIALRNTHNIRVMNLSLGRPIRESYKKDPLCLAVERAWKAGIVVVVAAGNQGRNNTKKTNGYGTIMSPGNHPLVITVGAINHKGDYDPANDIIASYSSKGPTVIDMVVKPDLVAPGNQMLSLQAPGSTLVRDNPGNRPKQNEVLQTNSTTPSPTYFRMSGTSMAAPIVSGVAALVLGRDTTLTPDQVKARLMKTARRTGLPKKVSIYDPVTKTTYNANHDVFTIGAGIVDASAAYFSNDKPSGSAASPTAVYDAATKTVRVNLNSTGATSVVWGERGNFATSVVWGENMKGLSVVWGETIVWGESTVAGFSVVWGASSPWGAASTSTSLTQESQAIMINGEN